MALTPSTPCPSTTPPPPPRPPDPLAPPFPYRQILVQNKDAGTVIGRGGGTVQRVNEATGSRVRVSNAGEHFPGTMERVVLVTGTTEQVAAGAIEVRIPSTHDG